MTPKGHPVLVCCSPEISEFPRVSQTRTPPTCSNRVGGLRCHTGPTTQWRSPVPPALPAWGKRQSDKESLVSAAPLRDTGLRQNSAPPLLTQRKSVLERGKELAQGHTEPNKRALRETSWIHIPVQHGRLQGGGRENTGELETSFFPERKVFKDYWHLSEGPQSQLEGALASQI